MDVREKLVELFGRCAVEESITIEHVAESRLVDFLVNHGVTVHEQKSPCSLCGYGGKHLDSPPCTQCPAHPKEQPNVNQRNSNASNVQEWISVDDRLPGNGKEGVLIVLRWGGVDIGWCEDGRWRSEFVNEYEDGEVTHWMPLPPPPKGE